MARRCPVSFAGSLFWLLHPDSRCAGAEHVSRFRAFAAGRDCRFARHVARFYGLHSRQVVESWYTGLGSSGTIPWSAWLVPLLAWSALLAALPFTIQMLNGLNIYFPDVPRVPLSLNAGQYLTEVPWNQIGWLPITLFPMVIGVTYLLSTEVSFSLFPDESTIYWSFVAGVSVIDACTEY